MKKMEDEWGDGERETPTSFRDSKKVGTSWTRTGHEIDSRRRSRNMEGRTGRGRERMKKRKG